LTTSQGSSLRDRVAPPRGHLTTGQYGITDDFVQKKIIKWNVRGLENH
jgi:hypothetical protein